MAKPHLSASNQRSPVKFPAAEYQGVRYWPTWSLIGLLWLLAQLPLRAQLWLGRRGGDLLYFLHSRRRAITRINLTLCFPEKTPEQRQTLLRDAFQSFGMGLFEMASLWFRRPEFLLRHCTFEGLEHLRAARASNTGVILLQAHFTTLELGANLIATQIDLDGNYDPPKNRLFDHFLLNRRLQYVNTMIDNRNIRQMVRHLRDGACVWYSPDQHVPESSGGLRTTFFDQDVLTVGGASRMAKIGKAQVAPYLSTRDHRACRYHLKVFPTLDHFPGESTQADTQRINDLLEAQICEFPEQYFWLHKRFKRVDHQSSDVYA